MRAVEIPPPAELIDRLRGLPAGRPLLERLGHVPAVYVVGGGVRDLLLGGQPEDLDLVVDGEVAVVVERLDGSAVVHDRFGTATVSVGGFTYDIARARREIYAHPGALPDVSPAGLEEDLRRRDFTVNAIALALDGALAALPGALEDLDDRRLRVLHDESFVDDPTRLLRLARYASRLQFAVESHTLELARAAVEAGALGTVSGPRIGAELRLLAREPDPIAALEKLRELGIDAAIAPGFGLAEPELARRALAQLPADGRRHVLALAVAVRGVRRSGELLDRLGFEAAERDAITSAAQNADRLAAALTAATRTSEIAAAAGRASPEQVALAGALGASDAAREWLQSIRHVRLEIDGRDLIEAGVPEGPAIGRGLRAALDAKLDGHLAGRDAELRAAVKAARD